jgi:hypothetical protein
VRDGSEMDRIGNEGGRKEKRIRVAYLFNSENRLLPLK